MASRDADARLELQGSNRDGEVLVCIVAVPQPAGQARPKRVDLALRREHHRVRASSLRGGDVEALPTARP
jgi:hypothetical protein